LTIWCFTEVFAQGQGRNNGEKSNGGTIPTGTLTGTVVA